MSAYLVSNQCMSVIAKSIVNYATSPRDEFYAVQSLLNKYHNETGNIDMGWLSVKDTACEEKLHSLLTHINMISLHERYEDVKDWQESADKYEYDKLAPVVDIPTLIDFIDCWEYQSCEGIGNETAFYKMMSEIKKQLALVYVKRMGKAEYWGISEYSEIKQNNLVAPEGSINISRMILGN